MTVRVNAGEHVVTEVRVGRLGAGSVHSYRSRASRSPENIQRWWG